MGDGRVSPDVVVNGVFFVVIFNFLTMAVAFATLAGVATVRGHPELAGLFAPAAGFIILLTTLLGALRSAIVQLLTDLAGGGE